MKTEAPHFYVTYAKHALQSAGWLLLCLSIFPSARQVYGHGICGNYAKDIEIISQDTSIGASPLPEWPEERLFAWRMFMYGRILLSEEQHKAIEFIHTLYEQADVFADSDDPGSQAASARCRRTARERLIPLLENLDGIIDVDLTEGYAKFGNNDVIQFSGNTGVLLFKVFDGEAMKGFNNYPADYSPLDVSLASEPEGPILLPYHEGGTSWLLFRLREIPLEECYIDIAFKNASNDSEPMRGAVKVKGGPMGTLQCAIRDEFGNPTPTLLNLVHAETLTHHRPSTALDFTTQMDLIAGIPVPSPALPVPGLGEPYPATIPGQLNGYYWCVPEPFDVMLPTGDWTILAMKGIEYKPVITNFKIEEGKTTTLDFTLDRWVDMNARGWYSSDDHIHSRLMSDADADRLMTFMEAADLNVGSIVEMGNNYRTYFQQRGFGTEFRVVRGKRALVPGQEDPRYMSGHSLGLNLGELARDLDQYLFNDWVADQVHLSGGLYGHAHLIANMFNIRRDMTMLMPQQKSDFGEILQAGMLDTDLYYDYLNLGFQLTAAAGSDIPFSHTMGEVRYYCYLGEQPFDVDLFFAAMKEGKTFVTNGPILFFTINGEKPGAQLKFETNETLHIKASATSFKEYWRNLRALRVYHLGNLIREVTASDDEASELLELDFTVPVNGGGWYAAEAECKDGTMAHTTAIYVSRNGMRTWSMDAVPERLESCHAILDQFEAELNEFLEDYNSGEMPPTHFFGQQLVVMAPEQIKRIEIVRDIYRELERVYQEELILRENMN